MPFHVLLEVRGLQDPMVKVDIDEPQLRRQFLDRYASGEAIVLSGRTVQIADLVRLRIGWTASEFAKTREMQRAEDASRNVVHFVDLDVRAMDLTQDVTDNWISEPPGRAQVAVPGPSDHDRQPPDRRNVFLVHGRDQGARDQMCIFLRALGLTIIEWSHAIAEVGQPNPSVHQIVDAGFRLAHATVVLMTADDLAVLNPALHQAGDDPETPRPQPRPNVIFEAGMAWHSHRERTVLVELGQLRGFSDLAGVHVVRLNNSPERRDALAQRLELAGCPVERTGQDWYRAGDFEDGDLERAARTATQSIATPAPDQSPRIQVLVALRKHARFTKTTGNFTRVDITQLAASAGLTVEAVRELLVDLELAGSVEADRPTMGTGMLDGAVRITNIGMAELAALAV